MTQVNAFPSGEPGWPDAQGRRVVFLIDAVSPLEERLLHEWIGRRRPAEVSEQTVETIPLPPSRGRHRRIDPRLEARLAIDDDPLLVPLRVAWQPQQRGGVRAVRLRDLLTFGDPRDPGRLRQAWVLRRHPDRCCIVAGEPATVSELRERWRRAGGADVGLTTGLPEFVARQAALALERAERRLRGTRYKVPRLVHEDILARPAWRGGIARLARESGRDEEGVARTAARYLREIAATHSTYVIDLVANIIRYIYTLGYSEALHYDRSQLEGLYALAQRYPVVFLPSHKSNLDHLVLQYALHENGHPPNHTAGGINMNFFPMGALMRRSGVFFIRRTFKDNAVYKFVLRQYIDYLIEKRFPLEWYLEGGRSRSGKLLPPHFGLLAYVADAYRRGKSEDVYLIPTSIAYDQIQDIGDYVAEQRGAAKQRESFGWFLRVLRRLRRRYGNIHISFGEPLSLAKALGPPDPSAEPHPDEENLALRKLAFEVSLRINRVTPITPTSLVTLALLGRLDRAVTVEETVAVLHDLAEYVRRRNLPTTGELDLDTPDGVRHALDALVDSGVVSRFAEGPEAVYFIAPDQLLTAAYYRNTIIHFFVNAAIVELALRRAAADATPNLPAPPDTRHPIADLFWDEVLRLRDFFKFEFFFAHRDVFRAEIRAELALHKPQWESRMGHGAGDIAAPGACDGQHGATNASLATAPQSEPTGSGRTGPTVRGPASIRPRHAHRVLRPYLEAYGVVADALADEPADAAFNEPTFLSRCVARAKQYHLQRRIHSAESVSKMLFENALRLARSRHLVEPGAADLTERRRSFADEIRDAIHRIDGGE